MRIVRLAVAALLIVAGGLVPASAEDVNKSKNVSLVKRFAYEGGSHIAFGNGYAYAGQINGRVNRDEPGYEEQGGVHIFDVDRKVPIEVGFWECPGNDHDVAFVRPGLIVVSYHKSNCGADPEPYTGGERQDGVITLDVSNPKRPTRLGAVAVTSHPDNQPLSGRAHALAYYPGTNYVYVAGGGLSASQIGVSIVDISDPRKPEVAAVFKPNATGCHDLSIFIKGKRRLGFCAGAGEVQIWDVSDPVAPVTIARVNNPAMQVPHYALASPDGKLMVTDDEAVGFHDCGEEDLPFGAAWVYDITDPTNPQQLSYISPPRGNPQTQGQSMPIGTLGDDSVTALCTAHEYNFVENTRMLSIAWYTGGSSIYDLSDPENPTEIAYYQPSDANTWTAYWYDGRWYANDLYRGFEVLDVKLPHVKAHQH